MGARGRADSLRRDRRVASVGAAGGPTDLKMRVGARRCTANDLLRRARCHAPVFPVNCFIGKYAPVGGPSVDEAMGNISQFGITATRHEIDRIM